MAAQIPELYNNFYGMIAWRFESFQEGVIRLRQGFEAGLSFGQIDQGLHCLIHRIKLAIVSGANLKSTLKEIDYYLHLLKTYKSIITTNAMLWFRETLSLLIDKGEATSIEEKAAFGDLNGKSYNLRAMSLYHKVIRAFWSGYTEQCRYYSEKYMSISLEEVRFLNKSQVEFYHGKEADYEVMTTLHTSDFSPVLPIHIK